MRTHFSTFVTTIALITSVTSCNRPTTEPAPSPTPSPAVSVTPTAKVKYEDLEVGTGARPLFNDTALVRYTCALDNGKIVDTNVDNGKPLLPVRLGLGEVIKGWEIGIGGGQGIPPMRIGGKRKLIVPPELGYGSMTRGPIPGNSTLTFEIELVSIQK